MSGVSLRQQTSMALELLAHVDQPIRAVMMRRVTPNDHRVRGGRRELQALRRVSITFPADAIAGPP